jgi:hypothetical protein
VKKLSRVAFNDLDGRAKRQTSLDTGFAPKVVISYFFAERP